MPASVIDSAKWAEHVLTALTLNADVEVVSLHGAGLRSLSLYATDITYTYPSQYERSTRWAAWLHQHTTAAGLTWTSHQDDDERAFVLWATGFRPGRSRRSAVAGGTAPFPIGFGTGLDWAKAVAASVRVEVI